MSSILNTFSLSIENEKRSQHMLINDLLGIIQKNHYDRNIEEQEEMYKFIDRIKFFESLRPNLNEGEESPFIRNCSRNVRHELFVRGDILFHYGDKTDKIFFMLSGQVAQYVPKTKEEMKMEKENFNIKQFLNNKIPHILLVNNNRRVFYSHQGIIKFKKLRNINSGSNEEGDIVTIFEEELKRATTTVCTKDSHCMTFTKINFENCILPTIDVDSRNEIAKIFRIIFPLVPLNQIDLLAYIIEPKRFEYNQKIFEQGGRSDELFLIKSGEFLLTRYVRIPSTSSKRNHRDIFVQKSVCQGEFLGEYELIMREERRLNSASCVSKQGSFVLSVSAEKFNLFRGFILDIVANLIVGAKIKDHHLQEMIEKKAQIVEKFHNGEVLIDEGSEKNKGPERSIHYFKAKVKTVESNLGRRGLSPSHIAGVDPQRAVRCGRSLSPKRDDSKSPRSEENSFSKGNAHHLELENEKRKFLGALLKTNFCTLKNVPFTEEGEDCFTCGPKKNIFFKDNESIKVNSFREKEPKNSKLGDVVVKNIDLIRYKDKMRYKKMILQTPIDEIDKMITLRNKKTASPELEMEKKKSDMMLDESFIKQVDSLPELELKELGSFLPHFVFLKNKIKKLKISHQNSMMMMMSPKNIKK